MSLEYKSGDLPRLLPAKVREVLEQEFACEGCGCRWASLGASFFCPACGHNSATSAFDNTLQTVRNTVETLDALRVSFEKSTNADAAADASRVILESLFPRLVGAFERLNEALFEKLPNASQYPLKGNVFQRVDDASTLWKQATGKGYDDFLAPPELSRLKLLFQRRHVLMHRQGFIDQAYISRSGDTGYVVGQRLVVREGDVVELASLLEKLVQGLRTLA